LFTNNKLDDDGNIDGVEAPLRTHMQIDKSQIRFDTVSEWRSLAFPLSTNTLVVSGKREMMVAVRSSTRVSIARRKYHVGAQEGCIPGLDRDPFQLARAGDAATGADEPTVVGTSIRALEHELGLLIDRDFDLDDLSCLGMFLDQQRASVVVVFLLMSEMSSNDIQNHWATAQDAHENDAVVGVPWTPEWAARLLRQEFAYRGKRRKATNHARASFALAARWSANHGLWQ
jgi:hypothetical protein